MTMIEAEHLSEDEAERRGFSRVRDEAVRHPILVEGESGPVLLVNADDAQEFIEDLRDVIVVLSRQLDSTGEEVALADVAEHLGYDLDEINTDD